MSKDEQILRRKAENYLFYPIMVKQMKDSECKEYHLKKLIELSKLERLKLEYRIDGSIWKDGKPIAEKPTYWQKAWVVHKLKAPASAWRSFA